MNLVVDNTSTRPYQLGDAWAAVLTLLELNLYFFNERRFLYVPLEQHIALFDDRNAVSVFREASYGLQWLLVSVLIAADDPADLPRLSRTPRLCVAGRNFGRKDASGGPDTVVIEDVMRWVERSPERAPSVVFYFPPLNRSYIEQVAGEDGWTRVRRAADELSLAMRERGLNYLDYTSMLEGRQELFGDYGHLGKPGRTLLGAELSERLGSHLDCLQEADCTLQFRRGPD